MGRQTSQEPMWLGGREALQEASSRLAHFNPTWSGYRNAARPLCGGRRGRVEVTMNFTSSASCVESPQSRTATSTCRPRRRSGRHSRGGGKQGTASVVIDSAASRSSTPRPSASALPPALPPSATGRRLPFTNPSPMVTLVLTVTGPLTCSLPHGRPDPATPRSHSRSS